MADYLLVFASTEGLRIILFDDLVETNQLCFPGTQFYLQILVEKLQFIPVTISFAPASFGLLKFVGIIPEGDVEAFNFSSENDEFILILTHLSLQAITVVFSFLAQLSQSALQLTDLHILALVEFFQPFDLQLHTAHLSLRLCAHGC